METVVELKRKRQQYYRLRDQLGMITNSLNQGIDSLTTARTNLGSHYRIDGQAIGETAILAIIEDFKTQRRTLQTVILPHLELEIMKLKKQIVALEFTN